MPTQFHGTWITAWRWFREIPRAYAQIFFARSALVGILFALATATAPRMLLFGLVAVASATLMARLLGLDGGLRASGYFGYNALLIGLGLGHLSSGFALPLPFVALASALSVLIGSAGKAWLTRHFSLPVLSLPFLVVYPLAIFAAPTLGLEPATRHLADSQGQDLLPPLFSGYLRSLGSIFFLPTLGAGAGMAWALLVHSRLAVALSFSAYALLSATNALLPSSLPAHVLGTAQANALILSIAIGGVWFVPSLWSAAWAGAASLACLLLTVGLEAPFANLGVPMLFFPFNATALLVLLAARERVLDRRPHSVTFLPGSPEENLAHHRNQQARFPLPYALRLHLPFRGRWECTQGVDGEHTHRGRWRHGFDFQVKDAQGKLFRDNPDDLSDYHCYKLPVLAVAPGTVVRIQGDVPDNPIGEMNLRQNWGNYVIIQHGPLLFSLVAHLVPRSIKVRPGQAVAQGEVLGLCGNSGRSPTPHIHFQLQALPFAGAETLPATFHDVVAMAPIGERLENSFIPREGEVARNLEPNGDLPARIALQPGDEWRLRWDGNTETIRIGLDVFGQPQLRSELTGTALSATRTGDLLAFHELQGPRRSVLALIRAALPRLPLEDNPSLVWKDFVPSQRPFSRWAGWLTGGTQGPGFPMTYFMHREGANLWVDGLSTQTGRRGRPLLRTRIRFDDGTGPSSVQLSFKGRSFHAERLSTPPAARTAVVLPFPSPAPRPSLDQPLPPSSASGPRSTLRKESP